VLNDIGITGKSYDGSEVRSLPFLLMPSFLAGESDLNWAVARPMVRLSY
jgi:hypothetical protein